jgi:ribosomal protein S24E
MNAEILKQSEAPLLGRQRVSMMVDFEGGATPSIEQFKDIVAVKMKVGKDLVAIRHIYQQYGFSKAKVIAHIYKKKEDLIKLEKEKKGVKGSKDGKEESKK